MTAASAGGPAGPPPRLRARRQARAAPRDNKEDYDTIIDNRWMAGKDKEGSLQERTTTNHCALKVDKRRPAERAAGNEKGKDDANEEDKQRGGGLPQQ